MRQNVTVSANVARRKFVSRFMSVLFGAAAIVAVIPLFSVFWYVIKQGWPGLNLDFFTHIPAPVGAKGGGMGNEIVGSLIMVLLSTVISIPFGIGAGIYLSEYGKNRVGDLIRFVTDVLSGVPSIVVGLLVYVLLVIPMKTFSGLAGGVALAIIMIPTLTRTTEQMLLLVPNSLREASMALGATQAQTIIRILIPTAIRGITTGLMLAIARVMGETAPLLFTALGSTFWQTSLDKPMGALPLQIFVYAMSPYPQWHQQAWTGALVLLAIVMVINILSRLITRTKR
jgi:phosphate transport system permease protein